MDLGDIEVIPYAKLGEDGLMGMEKVQALLHRCESLVHLLLELSIVDKVEKGVSHQENAVFGHTRQETYENSLHLPVLRACPL